MQREKVVAVIGLARAGVPAARFLAGRGMIVRGYDHQPLDKLSDEARALHEIGVELHTGDHGFAGVQDCDCVVLSPGLKIHHEPLRSVVRECEARGVEVIGELELAARHCPAPMIAVTGTKGKSTTVKLITEMLQACGIDAIRAGNTGVPLIAELPNLSRQSWAVVEVSSFQLERAPTFKPRIGVLLNLLADHQDYHPDFEQYWATKLKLFGHQGADDTAIFNLDDERVSAIWNDVQQNGFRSKLLSKSVRARCSSGRQDGCSAGMRENWIGWQPEHQFLPLIHVGEIPLRGGHNRGNVAAALAAVHAVLGQEGVLKHREDIADAVRHFESLPHRLEVVGKVNGVTFVNDSQATIPEAAIRALEAFAPPVTLIAGGLAKLEHDGAYDALGQAITARAHLLVTIGKAAPIIESAARNAGFDSTKIVSAGDLTNAVEVATMGTPPAGTVVLSPACASFDQFRSYEERGERFRAAVAALSRRDN
jgi:UDP-N-acetylmuramoylalanine--D-glutamate ligase